MIPVEEIPKSGVLLVSVYFSGYKDNYQNDSRKKLKKDIPKIDEELNLNLSLTPLQFCLIKHVESKQSRAIGVLHTYSYKDMEPEKYIKLHKELVKKLESSSMWNYHDIMVASSVGGI